ncbi:MAG: phenylalanine--tRNA ligase subunit alpha [Candidatus Margulisiibacteriota bacterium]
MSLTLHLQNLVEQTRTQLAQTTTTAEVEQLRVAVLGKKGGLTEVLKGLATLSVEERPAAGQQANVVKTELSTLLEARFEELKTQEQAFKLSQETVDVTLPAKKTGIGAIHPIQQVIDEIVGIFSALGFSYKSGPDVETDHYNFTALNIPADHPARDMHDTFYVNTGDLLRTHTTPVQIRVMETEKAPLKIIVPGRVYRCDSDVTHSPMFHQIEGLYVGEGVTFAQLKGVLEVFLRTLFGQNRKVRFRPSYFPFTEPSAEVDVECVHCSGAGCPSCKHTGWLEILGAGMVNRAVFRAAGHDPDLVTGFAFGLGIDRIAMLKFGIQDIRWLYENDSRFLRQFVK